MVSALDLIREGCDTGTVTSLAHATQEDSLQTVDPRREPEHLKAYHGLDEQLLPLVVERAPVTFDQLSVAVESPRVRAVLPSWLASAQWRGLVARGRDRAGSPRIYVAGPEANTHLPSAA